MMRVIAGAWRGRRLAALPGTEIRPTMGRVREALFSLLGARIGGAAVADLCCGAGALGIEALSRGAARVDFVDVSAHALAVTEKNLRSCGAVATAYAQHRAEAYDWLEARRARESGAPLIVLADPPYATDLAERLLAALARWPASGLLAAVVEHGADGAPAPSEAGPWRIRRRVYGHSALTILEA